MNKQYEKQTKNTNVYKRQRNASCTWHSFIIDVLSGQKDKHKRNIQYFKTISYKLYTKLNLSIITYVIMTVKYLHFIRIEMHRIEKLFLL